MQVAATLVNRREHCEGEQEGADRLHPDPLTGSHQRVKAVDGEVGPDERDGREGLGEDHSEEGPEALTDAVTQGPDWSDVACDGEGDADGRVDVTTARVRQTPHYRRDTDPGSERDLHDARMLPLPVSAQGAADKHEDHGPDQFAQQVPIESSISKLVKPEGSGYTPRRLYYHFCLAFKHCFPEC